jgi:hypothetical protein
VDAARLHLVFNHFPLIVMFIAAITLVAGQWSRSESVRRLGLAFVLLAGLFTIPTFLSGEGAEEIVEHLPSASKALIHDHEEAAEKVIWLIGLSAAAALTTLVQAFRSGTAPRLLLNVTAGLALASVAATGWVNSLGGPVSHPELRDAAQSEPSTR